MQKRKFNNRKNAKNNNSGYHSKENKEQGSNYSKDTKYNENRKSYSKPLKKDRNENKDFDKKYDDNVKFKNKYKKEYSDEQTKSLKERIEHKKDRPYSKQKPTFLKGKSQNEKSSAKKDHSIRLNRYLANAGICSRREADEYIKAGLVKVNGNVITELGTKIQPTDKVKFNNETIKIENKVYILLNKPKDYVTTTSDERGRKTVMELIRGACREKVFPVGRLDRNTTGVLLFTNDGELAAKLTHPKYSKKKIYHVFLDKKIKTEDLDKLVEGVNNGEDILRADVVSFVDPTDKTQVGVEIHTGQNRVVRRMFEALGYKVVKLDRVYFAGLTKKSLPRGRWRFLTPTEINMLKMGAFE